MDDEKVCPKSRRRYERKPQKEHCKVNWTVVRSKSIDKLSGEELLRYGALQQQENLELFKVRIPKGF